MATHQEIADALSALEEATRIAKAALDTEMQERVERVRAACGSLGHVFKVVHFELGFTAHREERRACRACAVCGAAEPTEASDAG